MLPGLALQHISFIGNECGQPFDGISTVANRRVEVSNPPTASLRAIVGVLDKAILVLHHHGVKDRCGHPCLMSDDIERGGGCALVFSRCPFSCAMMLVGNKTKPENGTAEAVSGNRCPVLALCGTVETCVKHVNKSF